MADPIDFKKKINAFKELLSQDSTTFEKVVAARTALSGIHPRLDTLLAQYDGHLEILRDALEGELITLSVKSLPEDTEEEKKRKAALLLFIKVSRDLESEIERVSSELSTPDGGASLSTWGRILRHAKGPMALVTIVAVGAVLLQTTAATIEIRNSGCQTLYPQTSLPIPLPGLSLPKDPIPSGGSATAVVPQFPLSVEGNSGRSLVLKSLGMSITFTIGSVDDVTFDGQTLLGKSTNIDLSSTETHILELICR